MHDDCLSLSLSQKRQETTACFQISLLLKANSITMANEHLKLEEDNINQGLRGSVLGFLHHIGDGNVGKTTRHDLFSVSPAFYL